MVTCMTLVSRDYLSAEVEVWTCSRGHPVCGDCLDPDLVTRWDLAQYCPLIG